jgi:hypothetical protein
MPPVSSAAMTTDSLRQEISALHKAEWTNWPHAYGRARDTPGHLTALLGDDPEAQLAAARHFGGAIVHQTSLWPPSPDAFDWLVRVLRVSRLPDDVLAKCLGALTEAAEYLGETSDAVPELSRNARNWLRRFARTSDDQHEHVWEQFFETEASQEVWDWTLARMTTLRPAVLELAAELADRAPKPCDDLREAWQAK